MNCPNCGVGLALVVEAGAPTVARVAPVGAEKCDKCAPHRVHPLGPCTVPVDADMLQPCGCVAGVRR